MSVVLLGIDMPKSCNKCFISALKCDLWKDAESGNRHSICPLRPLPEKHGRLIDADALPRYTGYALSADEVATAVENAPTIVEAEGD